MLSIRSLSVDYGTLAALREVSLEVKAGEVLALMGPNGAGKTTLVRAITGVIPVCGGQVQVAGADLAGLSPSQRARYLAVVPQARRLPPDYTVWQTVLFGRTPYLGWMGRPSPHDRNCTRWALERARLLELADRRIDELSGGEQQRTLLARALAQETPILLLDEPTAHLDLRHQSDLLHLVRQLAREQGLAVLMAVHDLNLVAQYADRAALLCAGRLRALGTPREVLEPRLLSEVYQVPLQVIPHPAHGGPLVLPDGYSPEGEPLRPSSSVQ